MDRVAPDGRVHALLLGILELTIELIGQPDEEAAGERFGKTGEPWIERRLPFLHALVLRLVPVLVGIRLADHHPVARRARHAVAGERAVLRQPADWIAGRIGDRVHHLAVDRFARAGRGMTVDGKLALALDAVTSEAGVGNHRHGARVESLRFAGELGEENRVAARQPHRRAAPRAVRRDVDELVLGAGHGHVVLQAGPAGAVAAQALIGVTNWLARSAVELSPTRCRTRPRASSRSHRDPAGRAHQENV